MSSVSDWTSHPDPQMHFHPKKAREEKGRLPHLEPSQKARHKLVHLQQADILADTRPHARSKLKHSRLHLL